MDLFWEINGKGTTVVIVTHDPRVGASSRRCIKIFDGMIQDDLIQEPQDFTNAKNQGEKNV